MSWTILQKNHTIDAGEVDGDLKYVGSGHLLPRGGTSLETTTDTYDLGADSARWDNLYCQNLDVADSVTADERLWALVSEIELTTPSLYIDFINLNGDATSEFMIITHAILATLLSSQYFFLQINGVSSAAYGFQDLRAEAASPTAQRYTSQTAMYMGQSPLTTYHSFGEAVLSSKTGQERMMLNKFMSGEGTFVFKLNLPAQIWDNTTDTITSLLFFADSFGTGTTIQLWSRQ